MEFLSDFKYVNNEAIKKTLESIKKNYLIIFTGVIYSIISIVVSSVMNMIFRGPTSIITGFVTYFIQAAILSNYLYLLFNIINYNRFNLNDFKNGFSAFIWKVYGVMFILYLGQLLLSLLGNILGPAASFLNMIIMYLALIIFNALPETIYLKSYTPSETVLYSMEFIKENWLNWFLPNIILMGLIFFITGEIMLGFFNTGVSFGFNFSVRFLITYFVGQLIFSFMMIYRGYLYKILSTSTRRKRMFMNKF